MSGCLWNSFCGFLCGFLCVLALVIAGEFGYNRVIKLMKTLENTVKKG
ncbi:MAG: hypothetical protein ACNYPD_06535 [Candidatus Halichondribacter symbioticus]